MLVQKINEEERAWHINIFALDLSPRLSSQYLCDAHVVKMTLETAQILSTVGHKHGLNPPYRATHKNHPVVLWAGHNISNIIWTIDLLNNLLKEYSFRYKKNHASSVVYTWAQERMGDLFEVMPFGDLSDFTQ